MEPFDGGERGVEGGLERSQRRGEVVRAHRTQPRFERSCGREHLGRLELSGDAHECVRHPLCLGIRPAVDQLAQRIGRPAELLAEAHQKVEQQRPFPVQAYERRRDIERRKVVRQQPVVFVRDPCAVGGRLRRFAV
jgi:hypothetical protein